MSTRKNGISRHQRVDNIRGQGPNWILIAGGALLSTLSIRFGYKLKQSNDSKPQSNGTRGLKRTYLSVYCFTCPRIRFYIVPYWKVIVQPMEHLTKEDLEDAACILTHLPVKGIMILASTALPVSVY